MAPEFEASSIATASPETPLIEVRHLRKYYPVRTSFLQRTNEWIRAVDDVSFEVFPGETLGVVGESGCGKSTLGRLLLHLQSASDGEIIFEGRSMMAMSRRQTRFLRREMQIIFQDPTASLNPRHTIGTIVGEPLRAQRIMKGRARDQRVAELLRLVGIDPSRRASYPHEFSGGQRQRVGIARAMASNPKFVVADEAVSALDVSVQAQVINLMVDLQQRLGLTYVFIAHGLDVVRHISDRVAVMYLGKIVEIAETAQMFTNPAHPYTAALLSSAPVANPRLKRDRIILSGDVPSPAHPPSGCRFRTRCVRARAICAAEEPVMRSVGSNQSVACHFPLAV